MPWRTDSTEEFDAWLDILEEEDQNHIIGAIEVLKRVGPVLGFPLVKPIKTKTRCTMRELRPASKGAIEVRVLFAWDKKREAVMLLGGDKSGDWDGWYERNISLADDLFDRHAERQAKEALSEAPKTQKTPRRKGGRR